MNSLWKNIKDGFVILVSKTVQKYFQLVLMVEEKLRRKQDQNNRGKGNKKFRSRGKSGRNSPKRPQGEQSQFEQGEKISRVNFRGMRCNERGRFGGRFICNDHKAMSSKVKRVQCVGRRRACMG